MKTVVDKMHGAHSREGGTRVDMVFGPQAGGSPDAVVSVPADQIPQIITDLSVAASASKQALSADPQMIHAIPCRQIDLIVTAQPNSKIERTVLRMTLPDGAEVHFAVDKDQLREMGQTLLRFGSSS